MSDWVVALVIGALFVTIVVLAVLLFFIREAQTHKQAPPDRVREEFPVVTPVVKPRIKLRRKPVAQTKFRRREILGTPPPLYFATTQAATPLPPPTPSPFITLKPEPNGNASGPKIKRREIKISLDAICKVTGIAMRECPCLKCQEMRADVGS